LGDRVEELAACGHLPHIDQPQTVARRWQATACRVPEPLA
jgi:pimeloyl-ACP methyl ester carboxylesterase